MLIQDPNCVICLDRGEFYELDLCRWRDRHYYCDWPEGDKLRDKHARDGVDR